jgi:flagellar motor protein MotB
VAQNLVSNGGFEKYDKKTHLPLGWEATSLSPDLFVSGEEKDCPFCYREEHCGDPIGKAFIHLLDKEVISTKLLSSLQQGKDYEISIFVQKPKSFCPGGVNDIAVAFTEIKLPQKKFGAKDLSYHIPYLNLYSEDLQPLKEKCKWVRFSGMYHASGKEQFFHIGTFGSKGTKILSEVMAGDSNRTACLSVHYDSVVIRELSLQPFVMEGIYFETGKSTLLPSSNAALDKLYAYTLKCAGYKIKISGHTDNAGDKKKNLLLSKQRAESVVAYLVKKGIPKTRLLAEGYGDSKPMADNATEEGKAKNRRVEVELVN